MSKDSFEITSSLVILLS